MSKIIDLISDYWVSLYLFPIILVYAYFRYCNINILILLSKILGYIFVLKNMIVNFIKKFNNKDIKIKQIIVNNIYFCKNLNDIYNYNDIEDIFIAYIINNKEYYITYSANNKFDDFKFPIYTYDECIKKNPFEQTDDDIIYISINSINNPNITLTQTNKITELIKKFSGPKGTFYEEKNYKISYKKSYIINYINKKLDINLDYNTDFYILYSNGNEKII